jgi:hypothetical protein
MRRPRAAIWALSLGLHLALLVWLAKHSGPALPRSSSFAAGPTTIRLLQARSDAPRAPRAAPAARSARPGAAAAAPVAGPPPPPDALVDPQPVATASPSPAPLVLTPARAASAAPRSMLDAALNDPRANTRRSASERFAASLGTDSGPEEERIVDGIRVRYRGQCALVHDSRAAGLDPFSQSTRPTPKVAQPC